MGKHIILVHGTSHGAWCWYKLAPLLKSAGHKVTVLDLAASGIDSRRFEELSTFADYTKPLLDIMASLQEKVILVGHSYGGINIAMAMEMFPEKVELAIFLAAFVPDFTSPPNYPIQQYHQKYTYTVPEWWMDTKVDVNKSMLIFGPQVLANKLYQLCSPEDIMLASTLIRESSLFEEDLGSVPPFSKDRYGSVKSAYIVCRDDLIIPEDFQRWLSQNHPVKEVIELEGADHMAMMSVPNELCKCLLDIFDHIG